uniref:Choline transporter-like protein n=1 Tax=Arcella intermedia TaxID=1963864 RepID=A0A6B2KZQ3_9EUKA
MNCCSDSELDFKLLNQEHSIRYPTPKVEKKRRCQDIWIIPFYILFWAGMAIIAIFAFKDGVNPARLVYGDDSLGNVCGVNNKLNPVIVEGLSHSVYGTQFSILTDRPYQYFTEPFNDTMNPQALAKKQRLCLKSCPDVTSLSEKDLICLYDQPSPSGALVQEGKCFLPYASRPVFNKCVPNILLADHASTAVTAINNRDILEKIFAALYTTFTTLLACLAAAFGLAFLWLILIRFFAPVAVWTTVFCSALLLGTLSALLGFTSENIRLNYIAINPMERIDIDYINYQFLAAFCGISAIVTLGTILVIIFNGNNITFAIRLLDQTSKAIRDLPFLMITPFVPFFFLAGFYAYFLEVAIYLGASSVPMYDTSGNFIGYEYNYPLKGAVIIHCIGFLWTCNFIIAILRVTVAGAVAEWYHSNREAKGLVVLRSFFRVFFWNFGSQLLGSFILPVTELPRAILSFVQFFSKTRFSCCETYLRHEEHVNSYSYIMMGIYGYGFREASRKAYYIIQSSKIRVGAITCITDTVLWLGKLFIVSLVTGAGVIYMDLTDETRFWVLPILFLVVASYFLACCFMDIYVAAAQTLVLCFIEDYDRNPSDSHCYSQTLKSFFEDNSRSKICRFPRCSSKYQ